MKAPLFWNTKNLISTALLPLSWLYSRISHYNKKKSLKKCEKNNATHTCNIPIIIIGNINLGGTGKTPVTLTLIQYFLSIGLKVGVISRGYLRKNTALVFADTHSGIDDLGDEPFLIYQKTRVPMVIYHDRHSAVATLTQQYPDLDVILSDDGLQHYALKRDIEIAVVGNNRFGNGLIFPSGPLREPVTRLLNVDYIVSPSEDPLIDLSEGLQQQLRPKTFKITQSIHSIYPLHDPNNILTLDVFKTQYQHQINHALAIAGIAYPDRFFTMLTNVGIHCQHQAFEDHHDFLITDFQSTILGSQATESNSDERLIFMTEKDAVKCQRLNLKNAWVIPLSTHLPLNFLELCAARIHQNKAATNATA